MRTGLVVTGVVLLVLGVMIVIGGAPIVGLGQAAGDGCETYWFYTECDPDARQAGAMFTSLGSAMMLGGGILALAGIGLLIAGVISEPKAPPAPVATSLPVQAPATRPCPACAASVTLDARYCGACGAAIAPVKPRLAP